MSAIAKKFFDFVKAQELFRLCLAFSIFIHMIFFLSWYIKNLPSGDISSDDLRIENLDIDFEDIPPELLGQAKSDPAPVEKNEWIEGTSKDAADAAKDDVDINALSGSGTDREGYMFSVNGDRPPTPIINFDLRKYFPPDAKAANITNKVVVVQVRIDEDGSLKSARVVSGKAGYGFDEAAIEVVKRARFVPGYVKGKPTKMVHELPIRFVLE